jgi:hypothetical protein
LARCQRQHRSANVNDATDDGGRVVLIFSNSGPMSRTLPRYISSTITKRLRQHGVEVEEHAMTRYVAMDRPMLSLSSSWSPKASDANASPDQHTMLSRLELYTVKSYDSFKGRRIHADSLVLAPSINGIQGTAVVPTLGPNDDNDASSSTSLNHLPWSSLVSPPSIACYLDNGRISTNAEFEAVSSIFAAGSVAKYPNPCTGKAEVAGGKHLSSELVGKVAATNMVVGYGGRREWGYVGKVEHYRSATALLSSFLLW